jgi:hypothetical protein
MTGASSRFGVVLRALVTLALTMLVVAALPSVAAQAHPSCGCDSVAQQSIPQRGLHLVECARPQSRGDVVTCPSSASRAIACGVAANGGRTLFHYTDEAGLKGIRESGQLNPSLRSVNPSDARYGNGQYLSDIAPGTKTPAQLSRAFLGQPFQGQRCTHFIELNVDGLEVIQGRPNVFVVPGESPLDIIGRIVGYGAN